MRKWTGAGLVIAMMLAAAACGSDDSPESAPTAGSESSTSATETSDAAAGCDETNGAVIGYSEPLPDPNFALIEGVLKSELERQGAELAAVNANFDPNKQISDIQTLLQQGIDALIVYPVNPEAVQGVLAQVRDQGIPVIVEDTQFGGPYTTNVSSDVETAAAEGAKRLKELVGDKPVAAIIGPPFSEFLQRSAETFKKTADEIGLNVVATQTNQDVTPDGARAIVDAWKQQEPDLAGIWTFNDNSAVGAASAFTDDFHPAVVSINGQPDVVPLIEEGVVDTTYDLRQDMAGRTLAFAATSAVCGDELPETIWFESRPINQDNVGEWVDPAVRGQEEVSVELVEKDGRSVLTESEG